MLSSHANSAFHLETSDQEAIFKNFIEMYSKQIKAAKKRIAALEKRDEDKLKND